MYLSTPVLLNDTIVPCFVLKRFDPTQDFVSVKLSKTFAQGVKDVKQALQSIEGFGTVYDNWVESSSRALPLGKLDLFVIVDTNGISYQMDRNLIEPEKNTSVSSIMEYRFINDEDAFKRLVQK